MRSVVLRVQLSDQPGELHELTAALSTVGINIIGVDVEQCDGTSVIDRLTLAVPDQVTEGDVAATVQRAGKTMVAVRAADKTDLRDPIVAALDWASTLAALDGSSTAQAEQALRSVADADEAWLLPAAPDLPGIVGRAARLRAPVIERATEVRAGGLGSASWLLAVPAETAPRCRLVVLLAKGNEPFSATQVARTRAMVRVITTTRSSQEQETSSPPNGPIFASLSWPEHRSLDDGTSVQIRCVAEIDRVAVLRMHARCSDSTLYNRFFAPKPVLRSSALTTVVPTSGGQASGVIAFSNGEAVGVASFHRSHVASTVAEAALLVEDAYQGRGLGPILLERLQLTARHLGILRIESELQANDRQIEWLSQMDNATAHGTGSTRRLVLDLQNRRRARGHRSRDTAASS